MSTVIDFFHSDIGGGKEPSYTDPRYILRLRAPSSIINNYGSGTITSQSNLTCKNPGRFDGKAITSSFSSNSKLWLNMNTSIVASDNFTITFWAKNISIGGSCLISSNSPVNTEVFYIGGFGSRGHLFEAWQEDKVRIYTDNSVTTEQIESQNVWKHFALTRESGVAKFFIDDVYIPTSTAYNTFRINDNIEVFCDNFNNFSIDGDFDDVAIIKGKALWTSNFTPPTDYLPDNLDY